MKKILFIILVALTFNANAQWVAQNSGTTNDLNSIFFPSVNTGYVLQDNGYMRKTTNGGANWNSVGGFNNMYSQIYFTSIDTGYVTGNLGVLKTVNGGVSWINNFSNSVTSASIHFPTHNIGYVLALSSGYDSIVVYKTINAGNSWNQVSSQPTIIGTPSYIFFSNSTIGFMTVLGEGIYKTIDGGNTWVLKLAEQNINSLNFSSANISYAVGDSIFKTIDGGDTWTNLNNPNPGFIYSAYFIDDNIGYICGENIFPNGIIEKTIDGGANWTIDFTALHSFYSIYFPDSNNGYVCGTGGAIYKLTTTIGINESIQNNELSISPNPFTEQTTLTFNDNATHTIQVMDVMGQIVKTEQTTGKSAVLDMSGNAKGVYFVRIVSTGSTSDGSPTNVVNRKIVLQ